MYVYVYYVYGVPHGSAFGPNVVLILQYVNIVYNIAW